MPELEAERADVEVLGLVEVEDVEADEAESGDHASSPTAAAEHVGGHVVGLALEHLEAGPGDRLAPPRARSRASSPGSRPRPAPGSARRSCAQRRREAPSPITAASYASVGASPSPSAQYGDCRIPAIAGSGHPDHPHEQLERAAAVVRRRAARPSRSLYVAVCRCPSASSRNGGSHITRWPHRQPARRGVRGQHGAGGQPDHGRGTRPAALTQHVEVLDLPVDVVRRRVGAVPAAAPVVVEDREPVGEGRRDRRVHRRGRTMHPRPGPAAGPSRAGRTRSRCRLPR